MVRTNLDLEGPGRLGELARARLKGLADHFAGAEEILAVARLMARAGELELAHRLYRHAEKLGVDEPAALVEHGEILARLGRTDAAMAFLEEAAERYRSLGNEHGLALLECALGELLREMGALERARTLAERWLTHPEVWDLATFLWVDCVSLEGRSLERAVKRSVERGNASPAMFHALLQELEPTAERAVVEAILAIGDETLFTGWIDAIPELRNLVERILAHPASGVSAAR